jgi:NAD(P)-dependent dehydrogenase (short-subunit alcohol dehydrogenase family)
MRQNLVVAITGASSGVGRATARAFASEGASVALLARGMDGLGAAATEVERAGGRALVQRVDVSDAEEVDSAADALEETLGPIDVWINDAMVSVFSRFGDMTPEEFSRVTEVTYLGVVNGTRAALRHMIPRDHGTIVQVGSALAYRGTPLQSAYCGAKHAIQGFTESVRCELLHDGSRVHMTMVQLPALNTPHFDVARSHLPKRPRPFAPIYEPDVAVRAIVWASRHHRREIWVGGSTAATLVANAIAPGVLDRYLARTGFNAQQTEERNDPTSPSNLYEPVPGDRGAEGRFRDSSHRRSVQTWATTHRWVTLGLAALAGAPVVPRVMGQLRKRAAECRPSTGP